MRRLVGWTVVLSAGLVFAQAAGARVLRVGTWHGIKGQYNSIEAAIKASHANDWILVAPGDWKTHTVERPTTGHPADDFPTAYLLTKSGVYLRGMNRNTVIIDGTKAGPPCNRIKKDQNFGPKTKNGPAGLNGIMVWEANNVWVQNLTACNFLGGSGAAGNAIWWNGGADSGTATTNSIHGHGYYGSYLTATSTFYRNEHTAAEYGIFSSNWDGGRWAQSYASNFNDSGFYIGACGPFCNQTVNHVWSEFNALGYSGSNSGGYLVIKNSQWDRNETGFSTNSQEGDNPPPQNGACPHHRRSAITHTHSCWVLMHNYIHDNNNPNVPGAGLAGGGPVGTGVSLAGARNDTLIDNRIVHNDAWGISITPFPGGGPPCTGGQGGPGGQPACVWDSWGDAVVNNHFKHNGDYGNPTNGDIGLTNFFPNEPTDCFHGNKDPKGLATAPAHAQQMYPRCKGKMSSPSDTTPGGAQFTEEVACDATLALPLAGKAPCAPGDHYPRRKRVIMHPLPPARELPTMPNPCQGVPPNPWCPAGHKAAAGGFTG
ncbi:MAG TPA: hypothetical protein VE983_09050 [Solirubrobacteraceae bacterium]|nr:hypothetical protein [Solirubrobacteraceae bacterium]